ncbi:uncharacterized protein [Amphiura filiformis]|uniref:uncharacterized protein isoform X2 n=1 Tax=Amphiura filiformis TaxID=82378 RepID=UPI003B21EACA
MDGIVPIDMTICKEKSKRSRVGMALVLALFCIICTLSITTAVFCVYSMIEMRVQMTEEIDQLQFRVTDLESRCQQIESGFPGSKTPGNGDTSNDAMSGGIPGSSHSSSERNGDSGYDIAENDTDTEQQHTEEDTKHVSNINKRQANNNCRGCRGRQGERGRKGHKGDRGERGPKGKQGERGEPGNCTCHHHGHHRDHSNSDVSPVPTTPETTSAAPVGVLSRQHSALVAHFEGSRDATIDTGPSGWVPHWREANWMTSDLTRKFDLNRSTGNVTVMEGGVYYVYSQMLYYDPRPFMGHSVYIAGEKKLTCTECTVDKYRKFNTCYIAGLFQIPAGGKVGIKVDYENSTVSLHYDSSFFGLIKLA